MARLGGDLVAMKKPGSRPGEKGRCASGGIQKLAQKMARGREKQKTRSWPKDPRGAAPKAAGLA